MMAHSTRGLPPLMRRSRVSLSGLTFQTSCRTQIPSTMESQELYAALLCQLEHCTHLDANPLPAHRPCRWVDMDSKPWICHRRYASKPCARAADPDSCQWLADRSCRACFVGCLTSRLCPFGSALSSSQELAVPALLIGYLRKLKHAATLKTSSTVCEAFHKPPKWNCVEKWASKTWEPSTVTCSQHLNGLLPCASSFDQSFMYIKAMQGTLTRIAICLLGHN